MLAAAGCWSLVGPGVTGLVDLAPPGADSIRFVYLGVGGWIIERGSDQVLTGPLFSNPSMVRAGLWTIRSDTAVVNRWMAPYDVSGARAILVGHAHYDHLMDVPHVARRHAPAARIVTNRTGANLLGTWSGLADRIDVANSIAGDGDGEGEWLALGPGVRVMPIHTHHGPHVAGNTLYHGTRDRPATEPPRTADEWVGGESLAFVIDFLEPDGSVAFRVYYSDAVAQAPAGLVPASLVDGHPVDVAILVPATFDQVDWHPEALVANLRPRWVLLGHWENFFDEPGGESRSILITDQEYFEQRLERVHDGPWWRPGTGTEFRFPVG